MRKPTGWHKQSTLGRPPAPIVWVPSAWENQLTKLSLTESAASAEIQARTSTGKTLRKWVRSHYTRRFVPEPILELVGVKEFVL